MFRTKAAKMLRRDLRFLNELKEIEKKKHLAQKSAIVSSPSALANAEPFDFALAD